VAWTSEPQKISQAAITEGLPCSGPRRSLLNIWQIFGAKVALLEILEARHNLS
jgi:hypothetical protein